MSWNAKEPRWHGKQKRSDRPTQFVINSQEYDRIPYGDGRTT